MYPQISVIVPVYKAEKYLPNCIDSILAQTFTDFELILVDDGSPDGSGAICDEYAKKDKRIKVIHKENGGVTAARADGVKISTGEFITFVDADDTIPNNAIMSLYDAMHSNIDIVIGSFIMADENREVIHNDKVYASEEYIHKIITTFKNGPCGKLYKKSLFTNFTFKIPREIIYGEDVIMNIRIAFAVKNNIKYISKVVYNYKSNDESCTHRFNLTFEYLEKWYTYIINSIPNDKKEKYMNECIKFRLCYIKYLVSYYIDNNIWGTIDYHKELNRDIKLYKYKLDFKKRLALLCNNPIKSRLFLFMAKLKKNLKTQSLTKY